MKRFLARLAGDRKGAAAVEFALIFPILFVLNIGAAEALMVYQVQRNIAHTAAVMADITAQSRSVTDADLQDILAASTSVIHPFPRTTLQQRVSSLTANGSGSVSQDWSVKKDWSGSIPASVPAGYLGANESAIVTDVIYDYQPTFGLFLPDTIRFVRHAYARPRLTQKVEKVAS